MDATDREKLLYLLRVAEKRQFTRLSLNAQSLGRRFDSSIATSYEPEIEYEGYEGGLQFGAELALLLANAAPGLGSLRSLSLEGQGIGAEGAELLSDTLAHLPLLEELNLIGNDLGYGIGAVGHAIEALLHLRILDLRLNRIDSYAAQSLAWSIYHSKDLTSLKLGQNEIGPDAVADVVVAISNLSKLQILDFGCNKIGSVGASCLAEALQNWPMLTKLDLRENEIIFDDLCTLIKAITQCHRLEYLDLSSNRLDSNCIECLTTGAAGLPNLKVLGLESCRITSNFVQPLLDSLRFGPWRSSLQTLALKGNDIRVPSEIINSRKAEVWRAYAVQLEDGGHQALDEIKVLLLGEGRNGKTHLRHRVFENEPEYYQVGELPTHDFENVQWHPINPRSNKSRGLTMRVWDFGGQPHLHTSHRFFLSDKRGLFVIVCDAMKTRGENRLDYWLRFIRHEASQKSPIVIVVTKCDLFDQDRDQFVERKLPFLDGEELRRSAGFPRSTYLSVVDGIGWSSKFDQDSDPQTHLTRHTDALRKLDTVMVEASDHVPDLGTKYPASVIRAVRWFDSAAFSQPSQHSAPYIRLESFWEACNSRLALTDSLRPIVLAIASNIGLIHFIGDHGQVRSGDELLKFIFNPAWLKTPVYRVIWLRDYSRNGVLAWTALEAILPEHDEMPKAPTIWEEQPFTAEDRRRVIDLMEAYELLFEIGPRKGPSTYLVPDHLDVRINVEPPDGDFVWRRSFDWLYDGDFARLIGRLHRQIEPDAGTVGRNYFTYKVDERIRVTVCLILPTARREGQRGRHHHAEVYVAVQKTNKIDRAEQEMLRVATLLADILDEPSPKLELWEGLKGTGTRPNPGSKLSLDRDNHWSTRIYDAVKGQLGPEKFRLLRGWRDLLVVAKSGHIVGITVEDLERAKDKIATFARSCTIRGRHAEWDRRGHPRKGRSIVTRDGKDTTDNGKEGVGDD
jgi:GTPase SAR1 family protein